MDTAISWWLRNCNTQPDNPYDSVAVFGNKFHKEPWQDPGGAMFIGNELRNCRYVGLNLGWALAYPPPYGCGPLHVLTAWGDDGGADSLQANPASVSLTDSDDYPTDANHPVMTYPYDDYDHPQLPNRGPGWYFNQYSLYGVPVHPYIMNVVTLGTSHTAYPSYETAIGSYKITNDTGGLAGGLHYVASAPTRIVYYETSITPPTTAEPLIDDTDPQRIIVDWHFSPWQAVPPGERVTITTKLVLENYNTLSYSDVYFTSSLAEYTPKPAFRWRIVTPSVGDASMPRRCGHYVLGAFELYEDLAQTILVGEYRLQHQCENPPDPESHDFLFESLEPVDGGRTLYVAGLRFSHSSRELSASELADFTNWLYFEPGNPLHSVAPGDSFNIVDFGWPEAAPDLTWALTTPALDDPNALAHPWITGGYVVGAFDVFRDADGLDLAGSYCIQERYEFDQNPEAHVFSLQRQAGDPLWVGNLRFGHSYGQLNPLQLCAFAGQWLTIDPTIHDLSDPDGLVLNLDWSGLLRYPRVAAGLATHDACMSGPDMQAAPDCAHGDNDDDADIDLRDVAISQTAFD